MGSAEVDDRGRVTIPKEVRDRLHIGPGDELTLEVEDGEIRLRRAASGLRTATKDGEWGDEAFQDAGEATFGDQ